MAGRKNDSRTTPKYFTKSPPSGAFEVLSPDCKQMYFSQANVPIKESTFVEPPTNSTVRLPSVQCKQDCTGLSENLMSLSVDDKALEDTVNSSEEEEEEGSSSKSEEEPQTEEDFLRAAGIVDFDLGDLTCNEEGLAPLELITNFLKCVMSEHFEAAKILCEYIIRLEPDNSTAKDFYPIIMEKIEIEKNKESEDDSGEDDDIETESSSSSSEEEDNELPETFVSQEVGGSNGETLPLPKQSRPHKHCQQSIT